MTPASKKAKYKCRRCKSLYEPTEVNQRVCLPCRELCSGCGKTLTEENQDWHSRYKRNNYVCKECVATRVKSTRGNKGFDQKAYDLKRSYNLSVEEATKLFLAGCEICGSTVKLCVDHCHTTGQVRGCLCSKCNTGLGMFDDDGEKLTKAKDYLSRFKKSEGS